MREGVSFFTADRRRLLPGTIKFWRSAFLKNRAAVALSVQGFADLPQERHRRAFYYPPLFANDLGANEKPQKPPEAKQSGRKGIQAATYGYANLP
jgi:hypothetical protein